ncbi:GM12573, partial [Drosophila sechellia]
RVKGGPGVGPGGGASGGVGSGPGGSGGGRKTDKNKGQGHYGHQKLHQYGLPPSVYQQQQAQQAQQAQQQQAQQAQQAQATAGAAGQGNPRAIAVGSPQCSHIHLRVCAALLCEQWCDSVSQTAELECPGVALLLLHLAGNHWIR